MLPLLALRGNVALVADAVLGHVGDFGNGAVHGVEVDDVGGIGNRILADRLRVFDVLHPRLNAVHFRETARLVDVRDVLRRDRVLHFNDGRNGLLVERGDLRLDRPTPNGVHEDVQELAFAVRDHRAKLLHALGLGVVDLRRRDLADVVPEEVHRRECVDVKERLKLGLGDDLAVARVLDRRRVRQHRQHEALLLLAHLHVIDLAASAAEAVLLELGRSDQGGLRLVAGNLEDVVAVRLEPAREVEAVDPQAPSVDVAKLAVEPGSNDRVDVEPVNAQDAIPPLTTAVLVSLLTSASSLHPEDATIAAALLQLARPADRIELGERAGVVGLDEVPDGDVLLGSVLGHFADPQRDRLLAKLLEYLHRSPGELADDLVDAARPSDAKGIGAGTQGVGVDDVAARIVGARHKHAAEAVDHVVHEEPIDGRIAVASRHEVSARLGELLQNAALLLRELVREVLRNREVVPGLSLRGEVLEHPGGSLARGRDRHRREEPVILVVKALVSEGLDATLPSGDAKRIKLPRDGEHVLLQRREALEEPQARLGAMLVDGGVVPHQLPPKVALPPALPPSRFIARSA